MSNVLHRRKTCRGCDGKHLELVFNLRPSPIGDAYVTFENVDIDQPTYPIDLYMCKSCGLAQLIDVIDPNILYGEYIYTTESSVGLSTHFEGYADSVISRCKLNSGSLIIDLGSNDGTLLKCFHKRGMNVLGVEPASHIASQATAAGVSTLNVFFSSDVAKKITAKYGHAKLVTANNVFANIDDLGSWVLGIQQLLADDGVFVFESYYLADLVQNMVFDFIYHEHLSAFSVRPIQSLFLRFGLELVAVERIATKGGSLRYFIQKLGGLFTKDGSVLEMLTLEENMGLYRKETYITYADQINLVKQQTRNFLIKAKSEGKSIAGFGASITGTTLIYHFEIGEFLDYLVDDNLVKQGRFSPGLHLPVLPPSALSELKPDYVIILAWRFAKNIIHKNQSYLEDGGKFLVPVPIFDIVQKVI